MIESNLNEGSQSLPASLGRAVSIASESTDTSTPGSRCELLIILCD